MGRFNVVFWMVVLVGLLCWHDPKWVEALMLTMGLLVAIFMFVLSVVCLTGRIVTPRPVLYAVRTVAVAYICFCGYGAFQFGSFAVETYQHGVAMQAELDAQYATMQAQQAAFREKGNQLLLQLADYQTTMDRIIEDASRARQQ